jgi:hypothetical protein
MHGQVLPGVEEESFWKDSGENFYGLVNTVPYLVAILIDVLGISFWEFHI